MAERERKIEMEEERERESALLFSGVSSYKGTNLIERGPNLMISSKPNHLPKVPSPYTITLGVRAPACEFGGTQSLV